MKQAPLMRGDDLTSACKTAEGVGVDDAVAVVSEMGSPVSLVDRIVDSETLDRVLVIGRWHERERSGYVLCYLIER